MTNLNNELRAKLIEAYLSGNDQEFISLLFDDKNDIFKLVLSNIDNIKRLPKNSLNENQITYLIYDNPKNILKLIEYGFTLSKEHYDTAIIRDINLYFEINDIEDKITHHVKAIVDIYTSTMDNTHKKCDIDVPKVVSKEHVKSVSLAIPRKLSAMTPQPTGKLTLTSNDNTYGNIIDVEKLVKHGVKEKLTSYYNNRRNSLQRNICKAIIDNDCSPIDLDELVDKVSLVAFDDSKTTIKSTVVSMTNSSDIIGKMVIRDNHRNRNTERVDIILEIARNLKRDKSYTYKSELVKDIRRILDDHHDFTFTEGYIYNILRANSIDVEAVENETV